MGTSAARRIHLSGLHLCAALALALPAALAVGTATAGAAPAGCPAKSMSSPFSHWGDTGRYFALDNGGFENGSTSWTLSGGAKVVSGDESYHLGSPSGSHSLKLAAGASAQSAATCFDVTAQTVRLMAKGPSSSGAQLKVDAYVLTQTSGGVNIRTVSTQIVNPGTSWSPSSAVTFSLGQSQMLAATATVQFTFTAIGGPWQIDDVYVDPFQST
jgi:hypothetical protein